MFLVGLDESVLLLLLFNFIDCGLIDDDLFLVAFGDDGQLDVDCGLVWCFHGEHLFQSDLIHLEIMGGGFVFTVAFDLEGHFESSIVFGGFIPGVVGCGLGGDVFFVVMLEVDVELWDSEDDVAVLVDEFVGGIL